MLLTFRTSPRFSLSSLKMLWSIRKVCMYVCIHIPARLRNTGPGQSHNLAPSPSDSSLAVPLAGLLEKKISPRLGCPPRFRSRQTWGATGGATGEGVQEEPGREGENPHWDSLPKVPGSPWSGVSAAQEKLPRYMASFSLWENLLSFISVSWMYRITLVSVGCRVLASFR